MVGEMLEEGLPPPLWMSLAAIGMEILVGRYPVVQPAIVQCQRDIGLDVEGAIGAVGPDPGQAKPGSLVAVILDRIVDGIEADQPLVDIGPGMVHPVVMEPEEGLFLPVIATSGPVQIEILHPLSWPIGTRLVVRVAVALRRRMAIVEMRQERLVRRAEVLGVQALVIAQFILKANQTGAAILGIDHWSRELPVESPDRAGWQDQRPYTGLERGRGKDDVFCCVDGHGL